METVSCIVFMMTYFQSDILLVTDFGKFKIYVIGPMMVHRKRRDFNALYKNPGEVKVCQV